MTQTGGEGRSLAETQQRTAEMIAKRIGAHEISGRLGAGGMGEVFLATDTRLGRKVALKILQRDPPQPLFKALPADARYRKVRSDFGLPPVEINR